MSTWSEYVAMVSNSEDPVAARIALEAWAIYENGTDDDLLVYLTEQMTVGTQILNTARSLWQKRDGYVVKAC